MCLCARALLLTAVDTLKRRRKDELPFKTLLHLCRVKWSPCSNSLQCVCNLHKCGCSILRCLRGGAGLAQQWLTLIDWLWRSRGRLHTCESINSITRCTPALKWANCSDPDFRLSWHTPPALRCTESIFRLITCMFFLKVHRHIDQMRILINAIAFLV